MSNKKNTIEVFIGMRAVQIILPLTVLIYYGLFQLYLLDYKWTEFIPSITELLSVFVGVVLAFYWDRAYEKKMDNIEYEKIFKMLVDETEYNVNILPNLMVGIFNTFIYIPKTTIWDIYKEKLSKISDDNIRHISNIYHEINILKDYIINYGMIGDRMESERLGKIADKTKKESEEWIKIIKKYYGWT